MLIEAELSETQVDALLTAARMVLRLFVTRPPPSALDVAAMRAAWQPRLASDALIDGAAQLTRAARLATTEEG
jgi:hypothetical protein